MTRNNIALSGGRKKHAAEASVICMKGKKQKGHLAFICWRLKVSRRYEAINRDG
jgi:hypothetical protein